MDGKWQFPTRSEKRTASFRRVRFGALSVFLSVVSIFLTQTGFGQPRGTHYLPAENVPATGEFATSYRLSGADQSYFQPVRLNLPKGVQVSVAQLDGFPESGSALFGLQPGKVYRLRLTNIPYYQGRELYPTLEILNRTNPPEGRELEFPIQVEITQEDLELALKSNLVTRVVYLENSYNAFPIDSTTAARLSLEVDGSVNPVGVAEQQGKVMAILRMGSRVPSDAPNSNAPFYFGLPPFMIFEYAESL